MKNYNRVSFAIGGIAKVSKITKEAARSKGARKAKEVIARKSKEFYKSLSEAKKRMYEDLGLTKEAKRVSKLPSERPFGDPQATAEKQLEKKVRKKLGIGPKEGVFATYKVMRKKYGLKGDVLGRSRTFRGKRLKGTFEERGSELSRRVLERIKKQEELEKLKKDK